MALMDVYMLHQTWHMTSLLDVTVVLYVRIITMELFDGTKVSYISYWKMYKA
jgi:hypothetical protein